MFISLNSYSIYDQTPKHDTVLHYLFSTLSVQLAVKLFEGMEFYFLTFSTEPST